MDAITEFFDRCVRWWRKLIQYRQEEEFLRQEGRPIRPRWPKWDEV